MTQNREISREKHPENVKTSRKNKMISRRINLKCLLQWQLPYAIIYMYSDESADYKTPKEKNTMKEKNYLFHDYFTYEDFVVQAETLSEATEIAKHYFCEPIFDGVITDDYAEYLGVDTY